jgi:oligoendopeptidase F
LSTIKDLEAELAARELELLNISNAEEQLLNELNEVRAEIAKKIEGKESIEDIQSRLELIMENKKKELKTINEEILLLNKQVDNEESKLEDMEAYMDKKNSDINDAKKKFLINKFHLLNIPN